MKIDGKPGIFLYASKTIEKRNILYYDYNGGGLGDESFPTGHFTYKKQIDEDKICEEDLEISSQGRG